MKPRAGGRLQCALLLAATPLATLAAGMARPDAAPAQAAGSPAASASRGSGAIDRRVDAHAIGAAAGRSRGGVYDLTGIAGQADAGALVPATSARFAIAGGFWSVAAVPAPRPDLLLADGFEP